MMMKKLVILGELTDLNTYIESERANRFNGAKIKKKETERVFFHCKEQKLKPIKHPVEITFIWFCKNKKKDKDNVAFSKKYILDGLVMAKVIKNDSWDNVVSLTDIFEVDRKSPRIEVYIL